MPFGCAEDMPGMAAWIGRKERRAKRLSRSALRSLFESASSDQTLNGNQ
jgi:uncharacterized protein (UPF0303 family)